MCTLKNGNATAKTEILAQLLNAVDTNQITALATVVRATGDFSPYLGQRALFNANRLQTGEFPLPGELADVINADICRATTEGRTQLLTFADNALNIFVEVQQPPPTLIIVGAGHVALPLAQLGKLIDFNVVIIDDRTQFANPKRFPTADEIIAAPMAETLASWPIDGNTHVVLVTRGHVHDVECLQTIIHSPARYIGMIGSKRRTKAVFDLLEEETGITRDKLDRVHAPIGLDIGAETPAEIAVCIIAEIINVYRGGRAQSISDLLKSKKPAP